jgi:hypothetical protein
MTTARPAPNPISSMGISRSHWVEDDVVFVPLVDVVLLVVVVVTVVA